MALNIDIANPWGGFYAGMELLNKSILGNVEMLKTKSALERYELESEVAREKLEDIREERSMRSDLARIYENIPKTKTISRGVLIPGATERTVWEGEEQVTYPEIAERMETITETVPASHSDIARYLVEKASPVMARGGNISGALQLYDDLAQAEEREWRIKSAQEQIASAWLNQVDAVKEAWGSEAAEQYMQKIIASGEPGFERFTDFKFDSDGNPIVTDIEGTNWKILEYKGKVQFVEMKEPEEPASLKEIRAFATDPVIREAWIDMETIKAKLGEMFKKEKMDEADKVELRTLQNMFQNVTNKMTIALGGGKVAGKKVDVTETPYGLIGAILGKGKKFTDEYQSWLDVATEVRNRIKQLDPKFDSPIPGEDLLKSKAEVEQERLMKGAGIKPAGEAKPLTKPPTQAELEYTAKKYGITVDEVKKRLGIK